MAARRSTTVPSTRSRPAANAARRSSFTAGLRGQPLEGRPGEQQALLAHTREPHQRLGLVAAAGELEDHALAEAGVAHVLTDPQAERLGPGGRRGRPPAPQRRLDDPGPPPGADDAPVRVVPAPARPRAPLPAPAADVLHQLGRDLVEEARWRVVLGGPEDGAAPGRAEVEPLAG